MGNYSSNPYRIDAQTSNSIDRKREQERRHMLQAAFKNNEELASRLVQRLLDKHIIETTSESAIRETFEKLLRRLAEIDEHDFNFKIAPIRSLVPNANILSLYLTQYIIEDLIDHRDIEDVFGDENEIYQVVDSIMSSIRPQ
jgi:hypothetical protein